jgi:FkbM family methyltransferase
MTRPVRAEELTIADDDENLPFGHFGVSAWQSVLINASRHVGAHRGAFRRTTANLVRGGSRKPLDASFHGCNYRLRLENNAVEFGMLLNPKYNSDDIAFLRDNLPEGGTFLDIGSNIGLFSLPLARKARAVLAIDANPLMVGRLRWNAEASGLSNVTAINCAVSDHEGEGVLAIRRNDLGQVHLADGGEGHAVPVRPLRAIVEQSGLAKVDCLKIDIEGHEEKALPPFIDSLADDSLPVAICIERDPQNGEYPKCAAALAGRGYKRVGSSRNNNFYLKPSAPAS